jgi:methionyl-tRNA synthetase
MDTFYLTTPIYYVNARPHIGTTYTTVVADTIARRKRSLGLSTFFLTGTDEHGQKIVRSAESAGCSPQEFTDRMSAQFRALWDRMGLTYDDFIRTTEPRQVQAVQKLFLEMRDRGYIYKGSYTGQYCVSDEAYVDVPPGAPCPECGRITETVNEENYFFKLSAFERRLLEYYDEHPEFIRPETRRNEIISFVRSGLRDLSISRTSFSWGIPIPGDEKHVIYVWLDALTNYISALGWGSEDDAKYKKFWPADLHLVGKEITRFHCVYWPAFLLAAGLPLPKSIHAHGWLLFEESKMSKSRGNIVRSETILDTFGALKPDLPKAEQDRFGADVLRYFLLREVVFGQDGSFSFDALVQRYNADLANGYGNLVSRTLSMIGRYFGGVVPEPPGAGSVGPANRAMEQFNSQTAADVASEANAFFEELNFSSALSHIWMLVGHIDGYLTAAAPWKQPESVSDEQQQVLRAAILYTAAEAIRIITALAYPVIPYSAAKVWAQLGLGDITTANLSNLQWGGLRPGTKLGELTPLFPRADKEVIARMNEIEQNNAASSTPAAESAPAASSTPAAPAKPSAAQPSAAPQPRAVAQQAPAAPDPPPSAKPQRRPSKLQSVIEGLAVALSESTNETATLLAFENALRETLGGKIAVPGPAQSEAPPAGEKTGGPGEQSSLGSKISIDDFLKVELRVAQVKVAERVPKADKLLRLEVDLGYETRQILAGIAESYAPESLIGRKVVIVANLAPRKLRGLESNGMIVAASTADGKAVLAGFLEDVEIGAKLK